MARLIKLGRKDHGKLMMKSNLKYCDYNHSLLNRKNTRSFYQRLPNFKMNYNILNVNLINGNNEKIFKSPRAKSKENYRFNEGKTYDFFL